MPSFVTLNVPQAYYGIEGDCCPCGRKVTIPHCPACGRFKIYAFSKQKKALLAGKEVMVNEYSCKRCGLRFTDVERADCEAPRIHTVLQETQSRIHEIMQSNDEEKKAILRAALAHQKEPAKP